MKITNHLQKIIESFRQPKKTAQVAKERLQIIISHERIQRDKPDYLSLLQRELLEVIAKYVAVDKDDIKIDLQNRDGCSVLELNITLPEAKIKKTEELV